MGERFTPHHLLMRYLERLAAASPRVQLDTVARTFEGREVVLAIVTGEANQARLAEIRRDAARLADPRGASASELSAIASRLPTIAWLGFTVHGPEASGAEAAIALLYQLAAGQDAGTRMILDSVVVLIDPLQNPDGHERHAQDVMRMRTAFGSPEDPGALIHQGTWPGPRTSHYYFDLNRDWYGLSHPETVGRVRSLLHWWPHTAVDLHEMGTNSTYFFAPSMDPINKLVHPDILKWWDIFAAANIEAFDRHGWSYFRREGYDEFYPGYGSSWPIYTGAVGMTYEQASSRGGRVRRTDGTLYTLHDAAAGHYTAAYATLTTAARRARERVRDYLAFRQAAVTEAQRSPLRAVVLERDDQGRADSLAQRLIDNGIEVGRLRAAADLRNATEFGDAAARTARVPAGSYVVDLAQPQGRLARALLEPDAPLDSAFIADELERRRTGQSERFYDITAWSLPYTFRVRAWGVGQGVGGVERVHRVATLSPAAMDSPRAGVKIGIGGAPSDGPTRNDLARVWTAPAGATPLATARYAYAFAPGAESSLRLLAGLLADSIRVWYAPRAFRIGEHRFPQGAFLVRVAPNGPGIHERVERLAGAASARVASLPTAAADEGTDLGSNSVFPIRPPRVALVGGSPISGGSFGSAWYAFDQRLRYPVTPIDASLLAGALDGFDVVVVPSVSSGALERALGESGRDRLIAWVRNGGALITLDAATGWISGEKLGLSRLRMRRDTLRADSVPGAPLPAGVPGAIVRAVADTLSPLTAGIRPAVLPVLIVSDRIFTTPKDVRPGEVVIRYAGAGRLRLAGYLWPEVPARLADSPYLWTERVGRGRVIGFATEPNFRDLWRGLLPLFANAVFLGASF